MDEPRVQPDASNGHDPDEPPSESLRDALAQVGELKEYFSHFVAAKVDGVRLSVKNASLWAVLGLVGLLALGAVIVTAATLLVVGMSQGVALLLRGHAWAGNLIVGFVLLAGIMLGAWFGLKRVFNISRKRTVERYERRLQRQRVEFGHDARERSAEQTAQRGAEPAVAAKQVAAKQ
jgi:hypothetical protein